MTSCPDQTVLRRLLADQLPPGEDARLTRHVDSCSLCQRTIEELLGQEGDLRPRTVVIEGMGGLPWESTSFVGRLCQRLLHSDSVAPGDERPTAGALPAVPGYEILQELGRGGMGVVYKARQQALKRTVALKMILGGLHAGGQERLRLRGEAELAARLQHPNIVQVHEVGEVEGLPFLALEFVDGGTLAERLARGLPPPREAARLVATLAEAVHAAHSLNVVHRDLKPANVLLTAAGVPKIADFGLARALDAESRRTRSGDIMGTPGFMAPEQTTGHSAGVGPAADIYALGATLYAALTGLPPFEAETPLATLLQVCHREALPPSRLRRQVPRDLETICLKCLRKEPARRYSSARELADDLERYVRGEPVLARPLGTAEWAWKLVRRRPAAATVVAVVLAALVTLLLFGLWFNARLLASNARLRVARDRAWQACDDMYTKVAEGWLANEPDKDDLQREFLGKALELYEQFAAEDPTDLHLRREHALAWFRVGQIRRELGRHDEAERAYRQALALQEALQNEFPALEKVRHDLADTHNWLGELLRTRGQALDEAERAYRQALGLQQQLVADFPAEPGYQRKLARSHYNLALVLSQTGQLGSAEGHYRQALAVLAPLEKSHPGDRDHRHDRARVHLNRGVLREAGQSRAAEMDYDTALALLEGLAEEFPSVPKYRFELAIAHTNRANVRLRDPGGLAKAEDDLRRAGSLFTRLATDFPRKPRYRYELANSWNSRAAVCAASPGRHGEAEQLWIKARDEFARLVQSWPDTADYHYRLGMGHGNLGWLRLIQHDLPSASRHLESGHAQLQEACRLNSANPNYRQALRNLCQNLAEARVQRRDHTGAPAAAAAMLAASPPGSEDWFLASCFVARCLAFARRDPRFSPAERASLEQGYTRQALAWLRKALRRDHPDTQERMRKDPRLEALRSHPDFARLLGVRQQTPGRAAR